MAYLNDSWCSTCQAMTQHINGSCSACVDAAAVERKAKWHAKPIDDKLEDLRRRIEDLERGPGLF